MKRKYKTTGCFRFFLAMLIIGPLAYLGASYYNGEDGIQNIKDFFNIEKSNDDQTNDDETYQDTSRDLEREIKNLKKENDRLKDDLRKANREIETLQKIRDSEG